MFTLAVTPAHDLIHKWLLTSRALRGLTTATERRILLFFSGYEPVMRPVDSNRAAVQFLRIDLDTSTEQALQVQWMVRLMCFVIVAPHHSPLSFFCTLLNDPSALAMSYWPCSPEDIMSVVRKVVGAQEKNPNMTW